MESTWETRDLPVLDAIAAAFEEDPTRTHLRMSDIAERSGLELPTVYRAVRALARSYLVSDELAGGDKLQAIIVYSVTDAARQAVGQWPSPDAWADRIVQALLDAADQEPDEAKKSRLRSLAEGLGGFGREVLVGVMSGGITTAMGS